jgi:hypothetical protein
MASLCINNGILSTSVEMLEGLVQEHQARVKNRNRGASRRMRQAANANAGPEPSYIKTCKAAGLGTRDLSLTYALTSSNSRTTASCLYKAPNVYPCVPKKPVCRKK